jgi:hypothetical protein
MLEGVVDDQIKVDKDYNKRFFCLKHSGFVTGIETA